MPVIGIVYGRIRLLRRRGMDEKIIINIAKRSKYFLKGSIERLSQRRDITLGQISKIRAWRFGKNSDLISSAADVRTQSDEFLVLIDDTIVFIDFPIQNNFVASRSGFTK